MDLQELNDLDLSQMGSWPMPVKMVTIIVFCALLAATGYYMNLEPELQDLDKIIKAEAGLRQAFEKKQDKAANLDKYRRQLEDMRQSFGAMLRQLPNKTEVADLLVDVSQTGLAAGLEFNLFQPSSEVPLEFYAELPIKIEVEGAYHEFGEFISGLASLPRIVTIHNIQIRPKGNSGQEGLLTLSATAKTYRYLDEEEGQ